MLPIIKWAGGKRHHVSLIQPFWERSKATRIVEPFAGAAAISLGLEPTRVLLNDINVDLINFYNYISANKIKCEMENKESFFYAARNEFNFLDRENPDHQKRRAELFCYLSQTSYNGLMRYNQRGQFNTPFGKISKSHYRREFPEFAKVTREWEFTSSDFTDITINKDDFLFVDPPYWAGYVGYWQTGFGWEDQVRLAQWLASLSEPIVATNTWCREILELYRDLGFKVTEIFRKSSISCATTSRGAVPESFITKNFHG